MRLQQLFVLTLVCGFSAAAFAQNSELRVLKDEDQAVRLDPNSKIKRTDDERVKLVLEMLAKGTVQTPEDKFNAALVLQHTGLGFCEKKLVGKSPDNYLLAYYLAVQSYEDGYKGARNLIAATIDRYLTFTQGYQKYGTQQLYNQETGKDELPWIDRNTTDSERAKYGVPPLAQLLKEFPERSAPAKPPEKEK